MKAALFDLDGVIVDTEPSYSIFWSGIGAKYHVGIDNFANVIKGTTLTNILDTYFPDPDKQRSIVADLEDYERDMDYHIFPHVEEYLSLLASQDIPCAIVTSSNRQKLSNLWKQHPALREYFKVVITDEDVTRSKPDPQPYMIAAERLGCAPEEVCVYEDSINGLISGNRCRARVVALATTNPPEKLNDYADRVIKGFNELLNDF